jgi:hypothetical protein
VLRLLGRACEAMNQPDIPAEDLGEAAQAALNLAGTIPRR